MFQKLVIVTLTYTMLSKNIMNNVLSFSNNDLSRPMNRECYFKLAIIHSIALTTPQIFKA